MKISIIIPTLNEAANISKLLTHLHAFDSILDHEILVADGGSTDQTIPISKSFGAITFQSNISSRAIQMNEAAKQATGDILYFVHADTLPPKSCLVDIQKAVKSKTCIGCFRFRFDSNNLLLKVNSFFTRFNVMWCRGGDQSLFITRSFFEELGGFDEKCVIMEDFEIIKRARDKKAFKIIPKDVLVSARKYVDNGYFKVQWANLVAFRKFKKGESHEQILETYKKMLTYRY